MMNKSNTWIQLGVLGIYLYFCYLMLLITLQYIPFDTDVAFLRIKQDYISMFHYRLAFFIHAYTAILVLPAGFTQFSKAIRRKLPALHRKAGWVYIVVVLLLAGPSGIVIGVYANGGLSSQIGFCTLGVLWLIFTSLALIKARKKDFDSHKKWMIRSFALTLSAITLRAWKYLIVAIWEPRPMDVYRVVAWIGWTLNLVIAEIIILKFIRK